MLNRSAKRWWLLCAAVYLVASVVYLLWSAADPTKLVLGEWKEESTRMRVEVQPKLAAWRGVYHGKLSYRWLQTEKEPYLVRLTWRDRSVNAHISFSGNDRLIVEPDIWDSLPDSAREMLRDVNRQHGRPEREFYLILRRIPKS